MNEYAGSIAAFLVLIFVSWKGNKRYKKPALWFGFVPVFSIAHALMGMHILMLAFQYDSNPEQFPLFAKILAPSYITVGLFGLPLEALGLSDSIAYTAAFGLNGILLAVLIVLAIQWLQKRYLASE